jgi:hypothetical protein
MNLLSLDNIIRDPKAYVEDIFKYDFQDIFDGERTFKNIQPRDDDEFSRTVSIMFPNHTVKWNFIRKSPLNQEEPNFIHSDEMMGDFTVILYLNETHPENDGTTIYDENKKPLCTVYSKFNRMIAFNSDAPHSRNIYENFGDGNEARLIQVIFLEEK